MRSRIAVYHAETQPLLDYYDERLVLHGDTAQGAGWPNEHDRQVRFEVVPGGHLGMLTGRAARRTTWLVMDEWITQWSTDNVPAGPIGTNRKRRTSSAASRSLAK